MPLVVCLSRQLHLILLLDGPFFSSSSMRTPRDAKGRRTKDAKFLCPIRPPGGNEFPRSEAGGGTRTTTALQGLLVVEESRSAAPGLHKAWSSGNNLPTRIF